LLRVTLLLTLALGTVASLVQLSIDLRQEKEAVESSASEFLASVAPSAASAAYNFYDQAAEQVVEGLFTQRAISGVTIMNEGEIMISRTRDVARTLPEVGWLTETDTVVLEQVLTVPPEVGGSDTIGSISITVDRSIVPPAIVNRMFAYFMLAMLKNFVLGVLLVLLVYGALTRYIIALSKAAEHWTPEKGSLTVPQPPKLFLGTEPYILGVRIKQLADTALSTIRAIEASRNEAVRNNSELNEKSVTLSKAIENRNEELQAANEKLRSLAERDALTGLYNRGHFDLMADSIFDEYQQTNCHIGTLLIDVDHFKAYNDYYGHQAGDEALARIATVLMTAAKGTDAIVARYGGEEFVAMTLSYDEDRHLQLAKSIHEALETENLEHQRSTSANRVTVSIGASGSAKHVGHASTSVDALLSSADEALYEAKRNGRNRTEMSTEDIRKRVKSQRLAARSLMEATEARQFEPFLQAQVDARTGRIVGAEALVRWRRDDGEIASPEGFLQSASETGLMPLIDRIMFEKVADFVSPGSDGSDLIPRVSLNLTEASLADNDVISSLLDLSRATPATIAVELLETALVDKPNAETLWQIDRMRDAGIEIEIDDFGTGRTSILGLMSIQPDRLKIAKELILPLQHMPDQTNVVRSVITIAKSLGVDVLAEGVETNDISLQLIELGCPMQQGFFFARPVSIDQFKTMVRDGQFRIDRDALKAV
jgi:diguanylate cyclase (GGDEF)-like protein